MEKSVQDSKDPKQTITVHLIFGLLNSSQIRLFDGYDVSAVTVVTVFNIHKIWTPFDENTFYSSQSDLNQDLIIIPLIWNV